MRRVASADIGSNTVLLLVAEQGDDGRWQRVDDFLRVTRISEGLDAGGELDEEPVRRTIETVAEFVTRARKQYRFDDLYLTGTAPFRKSSNGDEVARRIGGAVGTDLHVISGEDEAEYVRIANRAAFPELETMLLVDIGGASTEVVCDSGAHVEAFSADVGSVRLHERAQRRLHEREGDTSGYEAARIDAREALRACESWAPSTDAIVGVAGTVTSIAMFHLGLTDWDAELVHGARLRRDEVQTATRALMSMTLDERAKHPSIDPARADVLPYGAILLEELMSLMSLRELIVSDHGVRWGRIHVESRSL